MQLQVQKRNNIAVWGLGHVGQMTTAYLSQYTRHIIFGVDAKESLVLLLNSGSTAKNAQLKEDFDSAVRERRISLLHNKQIDCLTEITVHVICVSTPTRKDGTQDLANIKAVCGDICSVSTLAEGEMVVVRSTLLPSTIESVIIPELEKQSGKREGSDFYVLMIPCFARDIDYIEDLKEATRVVVGSPKRATTQRIVRMLNLDKLLIYKTSVVEAEIIKYVDNAFHALKITFANEVATVATHFSASADLVLEVLSVDHRLNISSTYLRPGKPYGGLCLPKDMKALGTFLDNLKFNLPVLHAIDASNLLQARLHRETK